ncbi:MAG: TlpA disulfide reductase family protein [Crocinitomicaceae bacterium]
MKIYYFFIFLLLLLSTSLFAAPKTLKKGVWYTELQLSDKDVLPFLFELKNTKGSLSFTIKNGEERILLSDIERKKDSLFVYFPAFDSEFRSKLHSNKHLSGYWINHEKKGNYRIPFWSKHEFKTKYPIEKTVAQVSGRWEVTFDYQGDQPYPAIGLFESNVIKSYTGQLLQNRITGTFLTETGDYRFLEGATIGDSLYLSAFDGAHAFLFKAQLREDTLWGTFLSGNHYKCQWFGVRNSAFQLQSPDSLTSLTSKSPLIFTLPSIDGGTYSYPNENLKGKVVLIQIMGTWCPNCLDESIYLKQLLHEYSKELEIIAVSFETPKTIDEKIEKVSAYRKNLNLPYTFLIGGDACKPCATALFPMLSDITSFPTLLFIDKQGTIRKIHTGFNGPGTGNYYQEFVTSTQQFIEQLVKEEF